MLRIPSQERDTYIETFEDRDTYLQNFKRTLEQYFLAKKDATDTASNRSKSHSSQNSILSHISAKKLAEETRKVELEAQRDAL